MDTFVAESCIRGHHVYQREWTPVLGEELQCQRESTNANDPYAVAVRKDDNVVGHVPRRISAACSLFIQKGGRIVCTVRGSRRYSADLPQGGLEIPCTLRFIGSAKVVSKLQRLLTLQAPKDNKRVTTEEVQPTMSKKRKIEVIDADKSIPTSYSAPVPWVTCGGMELSMVDKEIISTEGLLTDKHINFAQVLLQKEHQQLSGLQSTLLLPTQMSVSPSLQIIHSRGDHWIVATTIGSPANAVKIFDSLYLSIDSSTRELVNKLYGLDAQVVVKEGPRQEGYRDCGLFAIATATLLAHGSDPTCYVFEQPAMRKHLLQCFENLKLCPFPTSN